MGNNRLIMITFICTKQTIHLSDPEHEISFYAHDRLFLLLGQKSDLSKRYPPIILYARLPLTYTNMYHLLKKIQP